MARKDVLARFQRDLEVRGLRPNTVRAYVRCVQRFLEQLGKAPSRATECDLRDYLLGIRKQLSPQTANQAMAALRCFYTDTPSRARLSLV